MSSRLAALLLLTAGASAHATLVAVVPARNGVVVAADSRFTFLGAGCDGGFKLLVPARTVAAVTGDGVFVAPPPNGTADVCRYLAAAPRLLDMNAVLEQALASGADIQAACVGAVEQFQADYPGALESYAGREVFSVVVVRYDPAARATTIENFAVEINAATRRAVVERASEMRIDARSRRGVWLYGEAAWTNRMVYAGPGRRFLSAGTFKFLNRRWPVAEVSRARAAAVAAGVIRAAQRQAREAPPASGIGGAVRVLEIDAGMRAVTLPQR